MVVLILVIGISLVVLDTALAGLHSNSKGYSLFELVDAAFTQIFGFDCESEHPVLTGEVTDH